MKSLTIKIIINFKKIICSLKIFIISIIMGFILIEILLLPAKATNFAGGSGTEKDPYLVETAKQLDDIRNFSDKYFKQISDIDLIDYKEGKGWNPISFVGVYNGNNKKIKNLIINRPNENFIGLFSRLYKPESRIIIKNINLLNINIRGRDNVGGIAGSNEVSGYSDSYSSIKNCSVEGEIAGERYVGGITGYNSNWITDCEVNIRLKGVNNVGGIAGGNYFGGSEGNGNIENSIFTGKIRTKDNVGGIVGDNTGNIRNCSANAEIIVNDK